MEEHICQRQDVRERKMRQKSLINTTVKASLPGRLGTLWSEEGRKQLELELDRWIESTSQITYRLAFIWNRLILFCFKNNQPDICDALFTGMAKSGMKKTAKASKKGFTQLVDDFVENEFLDFPTIRRPRGDCQAITIAALRYKTNFINSCIFPFLRRQKSFVQLWCKINNIKDSEGVLWAINGWKSTKKKAPPQAIRFIAQERKLLQNPKNLTEQSLKILGPKVILKYYYHILSYYNKVKMGNKFTLAPTCRIKSHFLTFDSTVLYELLKNVRAVLPREAVPEIIHQCSSPKDVTDEVWKSVFNFEGLRRKRQFHHQVDTDGVSVCFHFTYTSHKKAQKRKQKTYARKQQHNDRDTFNVAVDPGRVNIAEVFDSRRNTFCRLTRKQYYQESGMTQRFQRKVRRMIDVQHIHKLLCQARSISDLDWYKHQMYVSKYWEKLWRYHTNKADRRDAFRVYGLKQKCLDRFLNKLIYNGQVPRVAYGGASINPTGKGELTVPVKFVYKKFCQRFPTALINEECTTIKHSKCQKTTCKVSSSLLGIIRGLRWCPTCRELVSRDKNACINILVAANSTERPQYLTRTSMVGELETASTSFVLS